MPPGRDQPQDGQSVAVRPVGPQLRRGACHLCAGEDHRSHAEQAARRRACKPRTRRLAVDGVLAEVVGRLLAKRWRPEQVARELRVLFAGQPSRWLCQETIYQAIYDAAVALTRPARRRRRRRRLQALQRRGRLTAMRMIDERPVEVRDRVEAGHWEGDLIMGAGNRSAIGTLVERRTRSLVLPAFCDGIATTDGVRQAITDALESVPAGLRQTLTWDQGKELALHQQITAVTAVWAPRLHGEPRGPTSITSTTRITKRPSTSLHFPFRTHVQAIVLK
jgi:IS30 family transposase